ncbi:MAG: D-alanyl-D-alanine carboxypeptidase family protein [Pseudomonadota bacterium]
MLKRFLITCLVFLMVSPAFATSGLITSSAKQAIVLDFETGAVLYDKNADEKMPTSSMSKVMTMYVVFKALKRGDISLDTKFLVSEKAWRKGGSKMFVEVGKEVKVEDLIRGVIVQSGNDATIVLAEGLAGSEEAFAQMLNAQARELGMINSQFMNASGWPDPDHYSTARDMAILAKALIEEFPEYYKYYSEQEFTFNDIKQRNRNPLLYRNIGADGVKTGHTEDGGYGVIGSGEFQGRRVVLVVNGLDSSQNRAQESAKLLDWGLKSFENRTLFAKGDIIEHAPILLGQEKTFPTTVKKDVVVTVPRLSSDEIKVSTKFPEDPIMAPVTHGDAVGSLIVEIPNLGEQSTELQAAADVDELGMVAKAIEQARLYVMSFL